MRRNMKFLLLLAIFACSITAAFFISGCGDDSTVIESKNDPTNDTTVVIETEDRVIGTIHGTVASSYDDVRLAGVTVYWNSQSVSGQTTTDANGIWTTPADLGSGYYEFLFKRAGYTDIRGVSYIPTLEEVRRPDNQPAGDIYVSSVLDAAMAPLTGTVTGRIYTALPAGKDGADPMAADDPRLVSVAGDVELILDYGNFPFDSTKYYATTDAEGFYTFTNVPLILSTQYDLFDFEGASAKEGENLALDVDDGIVLWVLGFTQGDSTYNTETFPVEMQPGTTTMPNIFMPLAGDGKPPVVTNRPVVLNYNFELGDFQVTDDIVINFSKPMDVSTVNISMGIGGDFAVTWDALDMVLTINPALSLIPDNTYNMVISGQSVDGYSLYDSEDDDASWDRTLYTQDGMRYVATNLDDYGDVENPFKDFPLEGNITIEFDMVPTAPVDGDLLTGFVTLYDTEVSREVNISYSVTGNVLTIDPVNLLESDRVYWLDFKIYSDLRGDYVTDDEVTGSDLTFTTENTAPIPAAPAGFAIDMGAGWVADWNTTSIDFRWNSVPYAKYYQIFAKDNKANTDYVLVEDSIDDVSYQQWQDGNVDLTDTPNLQFDLYNDDGIQTPFSGGTELTFKIRAVNRTGAGPFSAEITIGDETPPTFDVYQSGSADNADDDVDALPFNLSLEGTYDGKIEYARLANNPTFTFVQGDNVGNPVFILTADDVDWSWNNDVRDGSAVVTVPAEATASADWMIVSIADNSGNVGADTIRLRPWIEPMTPTDDFEAPSYDIYWSYYDGWGYSYDYVNLYFSYDGGLTWTDFFEDWADIDASPEAFDVFDTVFSTTAMFGLQDYNGGYIWPTDVFTYNGIILTGPDFADYDGVDIYDAEGTDSTVIPMTFDFAGLDYVAVWYKEVNIPTLADFPAGWTLYEDSIPVSGGTGTFDFYAPDLGHDYDCMIAISETYTADTDTDWRPYHAYDTFFTVINDYVEITSPSSYDLLEGGAEFEITWDYVGVDSVTIAYAYVEGTDTTLVVAGTVENNGSYVWTVPNNLPLDGNGILMIWDKVPAHVLDYVDHLSFSGIWVDTPESQWMVGQANQSITWDWIGPIGNVAIYASCDGFTADSLQISASTDNDGLFNWNVENYPCETATIRIYGLTHDVYNESGEFTIAGTILTTPNGGNNLAVGSIHNIQWQTIGTDIDDVDIHYSINGVDWLFVDAVENTGSYNWDVPNNPSLNVKVRVSRMDDGLGADVSDNPFTISGIIITFPNSQADGPFTIGNTVTIEWTKVSLVGTVRIYYSSNGGGEWYQVAGATSVDPALEAYDWYLDPADPNIVASNTYLIKIEEVSGTIYDQSNGSFEIVEPAP